MGSVSSPRSLEGRDPAIDQRPALAAADARDEAEVVVIAPTLLADEAPAADLAVVDGLGIRRRRGIGRRRGRRADGGIEAGAGGAVVRHVVGHPQRPEAAAEPPRTTWNSTGWTPWTAVSISTYVQIWRTAPAFTWRASLVSATS